MKKNFLLVLFTSIVSAVYAGIPNSDQTKAGEIWVHYGNYDDSELLLPFNGVYGIDTYATDVNDWDSQCFFVISDKPLEVGQEVCVKFEFRNEGGYVGFNCHGHGDPLQYVNNDGWSMVKAVNGEWQTFETTFEATGHIRSLSINCSMARQNAKLLLRNIVVEVDGNVVIETPKTEADTTLDFNLQVGGIQYTIINSNKCVLSDVIDKSVTTIEIPETVKYEEFTFPISIIGEGAFQNCNSLVSISIPNTVVSFSNKAFYGCSGLTSIVIPNSVKKISSNMFGGCSSLTTISIPNSVTFIAYNAFEGCDNLQYSEYDNGLYLGNDDNPYLWLIKSKSTYTFTCKINENCKFICDRAFYGNTILTSVNLPYSVIGINESPFADCHSLTSVLFNNTNVEFLYSFPNIETLYIGDSVKVIDDDLLRLNFNRLTNVVVMSAEPPELYSEQDFNSFYFPPYTYYVPAVSIENYKSAPVWRERDYAIKPFYKITAHSADEAAGTITGDIVQLDEAPATIIASPFVGYHFTHWSDGNTDAIRKLTIVRDTSIIAYFAVDTFDVKVMTNNEMFGSVSGTARYTYGGEATVVAVPAANYHFVSWSNGVLDSLYTFIVDKSLTLTAKFEGDKCSVILNAENGIVTSSVSVYRYGENVTLTATANAGYHFVKWSDDNTDNPRSITIICDLELTAIFEDDEKQSGNNTNPTTAVSKSAVSTVNIYTIGNSIVVENATMEIRVYNAMGGLVATSKDANAKIGINGSGVYIVKVGSVVKRVVVN